MPGVIFQCLEIEIQIRKQVNFIDYSQLSGSKHIGVFDGFVLPFRNSDNDDALSIIDVVQPQHGTAFITADGQLSFIPEAGYNGEPMPLDNPRLLLTARLKLQGFIVSEHLHLWPAALKELAERVATGQLKYRESVALGLSSAPEAFLGLLKGRNFGKQLVKLA